MCLMLNPPYYSGVKTRSLQKLRKTPMDGRNWLMASAIIFSHCVLDAERGYSSDFHRVEKSAVQ
jgi:hypothetical protein